MIYYIDFNHGSPDADGLTPETARQTYTDLAIEPGDTVLFKRGSWIRDCLYRKPGAPGKPITYGAYGNGENPVFIGSVDVSDPAMWKEIRQNVWVYQGKLDSEACNFIFDDGRIGGTLRWEEAYLCAQGDWYDSTMGHRDGGKDGAGQQVFLYSVGNPGEVYSHIECATWGQGRMSLNQDWTVTEDLCFWGSGVHGFAGGADNVVIRRCSFCFIGGAVWNRQLGIRFGNAIEFWDHGENILIEDCYFNNIYDSAITQQGSGGCLPATNLIMRGNLFIAYGMGAYEGRDRMLIGSSFNDNLCIQAGYGFTGFGDTKPRHSEIYPQPMGHHVFMWRIPNPTEGGSFEVARNHFYEATGAAMYAIIGKEADGQMHLHDNIYWTTNTDLFQHVGGNSYKPSEFDKYMAKYKEDGAIWSTAPDLAAEVEAWFARTGCSRNGAHIFTDALPTQKYFLGGTENAIGYQVWDEIHFHLTLTDEGKTITAPAYKYECWGEDGSHDSGLVVGESATFDYTTSLSKPGYVHLLVQAADENGVPLPGYDAFEGGAAAGFDTLHKIGGEPADYDAWWHKVIMEELDPVAPVEIEKKEFACGDPGDIVYDVKIACAGPMPVSGYLRLPRHAAPHSLPIRVSYMGYSVMGAPIPSKDNAIQLYINPHGFANGLTFEEYADMAKEAPYAEFGFHKELNEKPDTVYFKYMILRAMQAVRYCKTLELWDGKTIIVSGGSMGAFQPTHVAAFDKSVTKLEIQIPWMCDLRGIEGGRLRGWRPDPAVGLDYFDTVTAGARVTCETYITAGLGDYVCPPSGVTSLYHAIPAEQKTLLMLQNKTHPYTAPHCDTCRVSTIK